MKKQINIIGSYFSADGYGSHTRQLCKALSKYYDICLLTNRPQDISGISDDEYQMLNRNPEESETAIFIGLPPQWKAYMYDYKNFYGFCVWEGDSVPKNWINIFNNKQIKGIFVPSNHTKDAILNTGAVATDVHIIPHGVNTNIFYPKDKKPDALTFIVNGGWVHGFNDRKGISYLVQAYSDEFTKKDKVKLVIKVNVAYGCDIAKNMKEIKVDTSNAPKVDVILENGKYESLNDFYNQGDVYVCTSLAEGFNLGCLEAMACKIPCISTLYGGMSDFIDKDNGWLLEKGTMKEVDYDVMYEGISWKHPDIKEIREKLRYVFNNQEEIKEKGLKALERAKEFSWDNSAKLVFDIIS